VTPKASGPSGLLLAQVILLTPPFPGGMLVVGQMQGQAIIGIDRSGHYANDTAAFEKWMQEFKELDKRQLGEMQNR
jgi:hypothetical protein